MSNEISIIIIGVYTIVYVIVFLIQKSQIEKQKDVISSMKSFMEIFKVDEVKKYVEMKNERILDQVDSMITNDQKVQDMVKHVTNEKIKEIQDFYLKEMGNRHIEMADVIIKILLNLEKDEAEKFIMENLKSSAHIFLPIIEGKKDKQE